MYKTEITVNNKVIPIVLSFMGVGKLEEIGVPLSELGKIDTHTVSIISKIIYANALATFEGQQFDDIDKGLKVQNKYFNIKDIYDWVGNNAKESTVIITEFIQLIEKWSKTMGEDVTGKVITKKK